MKNISRSGWSVTSTAIELNEYPSLWGLVLKTKSNLTMTVAPSLLRKCMSTTTIVVPGLCFRRLALQHYSSAQCQHVMSWLKWKECMLVGLFKRISGPTCRNFACILILLWTHKHVRDIYNPHFWCNFIVITVAFRVFYTTPMFLLMLLIALCVIWFFVLFYF